jgi:colicin import membrane protein
MKKLPALLALLIFVLPVWSAEPENTPIDENPPAAAVADNAVATNDPATLKAQAAQLLNEARATRAAAEAEYPRAQKACWQTFLVSRCLAEVGQKYRDEKLKASQMESRARAMQRDLKRREITERDAKRAIENATRATQ